MNPITTKEIVFADLVNTIGEIHKLIKINGCSPSDYDVLKTQSRRLVQIIPNKRLDFDSVEDVVLPFVWDGSSKDFRRMARCRDANLVRARGFIFYFVRLLTGLGQTKTGYPYGKNHSSVWAAIRTLQNQLYLPKNMATYRQIISEFEALGYKIPKDEFLKQYPEP